jgi:hypothetical protein
MKSRILIFFAMAFIGNVVSAKAQCKSIKDPFTGEEKTSYIHTIFGVLVIKMELEKDGSAIFYFRDAEPRIIDTPIPAGSPFLMLLEGGETIELALMEECKPNSGAISGSASGTAFTEWLEKMKMTKEQINALSQKKVTHLKYKRHDGSESIFDCKKQKLYKMEKNLMAASKCMAGTK